MTKLVRYAPHTHRSPFGLDLNRLFGEAFPFDGPEESPAAWRPLVDIAETESDFVVTADLPGVGKDDVSVNFEEDTLTITGDRKQESTTEETNFFRTERIYGRFSRSFTFPKGIKIDKISASFDNGVLHVTVPKTAESKPRKIKIV
ncbi:MAG: Hsp20/alpha crystallin family protein [Rhodothermia bacterium]